MIADLSAGKAPDVYVMKNLQHFYTYQHGGQLADVSDVASAYGKNVSGLDAYKVDGKTYAIPYRQDSWVLYYNKDLFTTAGVAAPGKCWTWDEYVAAAKKLTSGLKAKGNPAVGVYQHTWQSVIQGFANAQGSANGAGALTGDYGYMKPFYQRALDLQDSGAAPTYGTAKTNNLAYGAEFGTQKVAMMPMGTWNVASLLAQQKSGDANKFAWGIAPAPQVSCPADTPVTFGDPTGLGINPAIAKDKLAAAKKFLGFISSEQGAQAMAKIGNKPAFISDAVTSTYFSAAGVPTDDLSKFAFSTADVKPENQVSAHTAEISTILGDAHSAIMSGSSSADAALSDAAKKVAELKK